MATESMQPVSWNAAPPSGAGRVALIAGALGFALGALVFPTNQESVQIAQVVGGVVQYPDCNPFAWYQTKVWTVYIQIMALLMSLGVSERTLCYIFSGVLGMVSYQAIALCVFAVGRNILLAIISAVLIHMSCVWSFYSPHPIFLMGHWSAQNSLGLATTLLGIVLVGAGSCRVGAFLLGFSPAVHAAWGAAAWAIFAGSVVWGWLERNAHHEAMIKLMACFFLMGILTAGTSLVVHLALTCPTACTIPPQEVILRFRDAFLTAWHYHQVALMPYESVFLLNIAAIIAASLALRCSAGNQPPPALFLLRSLVVSGLIATAFAVVTWAPVSWMPLIVQELVPGRFVDLNVLALMPLLIGLLGLPAKWGGHPVLAYVPLSILLLSGTDCLRGAPLKAVQSLSLGAIYVAFGLLCLVKWKRDLLERLTERIRSLAANNVARLTAIAMGGILSLLLVLAAVKIFAAAEHSTCFRNFVTADWDLITDSTDDPLYAQLARGNGFVVTDPWDFFIQIRTRRPCLLRVNLTELNYLPEAGPEFDRILRAVYGVSLFDPQTGAPSSRVTIYDLRRLKAFWEQRPRSDWIELRSRFGVTNVVTRVGWKLHLPKIIEHRFRAVFEIPER